VSEPYLPADTTLEAIRVVHGVFRRMPAERRLRMGCQMADSARNALIARARARHPEYTERQVELAAIRALLGEELFRRAYPGEEARL
jgi:hypothetical protein